LIRGWIPVRVKKTRQNKNLQLGSDSIRTELQARAERSGRTIAAFVVTIWNVHASGR
jgi:hypothetical protein